MSSRPEKIFKKQKKRYVLGLIIQVIILFWTVFYIAETVYGIGHSGMAVEFPENESPMVIAKLLMLLNFYYLWIFFPLLALCGFIGIINGDVTAYRRMVFFKVTDIFGIFMSLFLYWLYVVCNKIEFFSYSYPYSLLIIFGMVIQVLYLFLLFRISRRSNRVNNEIIDATYSK